MDYAEVLANAKKNIGPNCKVCPECNGLACANTMPGPGSKAPGNGANDNWKAWRGIKLNMDTIFPDAPVDTGIELFGKRLSMPLISAPVGSLKAQYNPTDDIRDFNECCAQAAEICGIASSFGDGARREGVSSRLRAVDSARRHRHSGDKSAEHGDDQCKS